MTTITLDRSRWRFVTGTVWTLQVLAAAMFLFAGTHKLTNDPTMVQVFGTIGLGQWFRYLTGGIEVVAGVLLLIPSLAVYGAIVLAVTMVGAIVTHLFILGGSAAPAAVLFLATVGIVWIRRRQLLERIVARA
jgi:uncharacterized membrane protein YphA (DoxX/SURF4 family)